MTAVSSVDNETHSDATTDETSDGQSEMGNDNQTFQIEVTPETVTDENGETHELWKATHAPTGAQSVSPLPAEAAFELISELAYLGEIDPYE